MNLLLALSMISQAAVLTAASNVVPGSADGAVDVTSSGSVVYSVPLKIAPGSAGMTPKLSLVYSSQSGLGPIGVGWTLQGLSAVTRGPKNIADDGVAAGIALLPGDAIFIDGERAIPVSRNNMIVEYRSRIDNQSRIIAKLDNLSNPLTFTVQTRAGLTMIYGGTEDSRIKAENGAVIVWACNRVLDSCSNYIDFEYRSNNLGDYGLSHVRYTGNIRANTKPYASVDLTYTTLANPPLTFLSGTAVVRDSKLTGIRSYDHGLLVAEYHFNYVDVATAGRFVLKELQEVGSDGTSYRPTSFRYTIPTPGWEKVANFAPPVSFASDVVDASAVKCCDLNGKGLVGVLYARRIAGRLRSQAFILGPGGWNESSSYAPPIPFADETGLIRSVQLIDVTGDGLCDIVFAPNPGEGTAHTFVNTGNGWRDDPNLALPIALVPTGQSSSPIVFLDIDGDLRKDAIWNFVDSERITQRGAVLNRPNGWFPTRDFEPSLSTSVNANDEPSVFVVDVNCDLHSDLMYRRRTDGGGFESRVFLWAANGWREVADNGFKLPINADVSGHSIKFLDVNGDGFLDSLIGYDTDSSRIRQAFLANKVGWKESLENAPPITFANSSYGSLAMVIADLDGDGRLDLVGRTQLTDQQDVKGAFLNKQAGWKSVPAFIPPSPLRDFRGPSIVTCLSDCDGDKHSDLLYLHSPTGPAVYLNTDHGWSLSVNLSPPQPISGQDKQDLGVRFLDVNGDGLVDMLWGRESDGAKGALLNTGHGWQRDDRFAPPVFIVDKKGNDAGVRFVDVTGDGRSDLIFSFERIGGNLSNGAFRNTRTGWVKDNLYNPPIVFSSQTKGDGGAQLADLNGDGLTDIAYAVRDTAGNETRGAFINTGSGWRNDAAYSPSCLFSAIFPGQDGQPVSLNLGCLLIDVNGDRLPDLIYKYHIPKPGGPGPEVAGAFVNTGHGWQMANTFTPPLRLDGGDANQQVFIQSDDTNGDGITDLIYVLRGPGDAKSSQVHLGTGTGWRRFAAWDIPVDAIGAGQSDPGFRLIDVNGDGLIDIVFNRIEKQNQQFSGAYLNSGFGWRSQPSYAAPLPLSQYGQVDLGVRLADVNGDGLPDVIENRSSSGGDMQVAYLNRTSSRSDLLEETVNGNGVRTKVTHRSLSCLQGSTSSTISPLPSAAAQYPVVDTVPSLYVVETMNVAHQGGRMERYSYKYGALRANIQSGRPLGFSWREMKNEVSGVVSHTTFIQEDVLVGQVKSTRTLASKSIVNEVANTFTTLPKKGAPNDAGQPFWYYQVLLASSYTENHDLDGTPVSMLNTTYEYDAFANPTRVTLEIPNEKKSVTQSFYDNDIERWFLGRLRKAVRTTSGPGQEEQSRTTEFSYDTNTGLLVMEKIDSDMPDWLSQEYRYDTFGNKSVSRITAPDIETREKRGVFDCDGRFLIKQVNELGHVTTTNYDGRFGLPTRVTGANGRITETVYDGHGREVETTDSSGVVTRTKYTFAPQSMGSDSAIYLVERATEGLSSAIRYVDDTGKVVRTMTPGFKDRRVIQDSTYDPLGRPYQLSRPYYQGDTPEWTTTTYDSLDRPILITYPGKTTRHNIYSGRTSVTIDPKGRKTTATYNSRALLVAVKDTLGSVHEITYDATDKVTHVRRADGSVVNFAYDRKGRRTSIDDPDTGSWSYHYDALDQLIKQVDAKAQVTEISYDLLGRPTCRRQADLTTLWTYDSAPNGIGMVAHVSSSNGYIESYEYDAAGRPAQFIVRTIDGCFITKTEHDKYGRAVSITYPTGFVVRNHFDNSNTLYEALDPSSGTVLWCAKQVDAVGRIMTEMFGNGVTNVRSFSLLNGQLDAEKATDSCGRTIQHFAYKYDTVGNLAEAIDAACNTARHFDYDELDRLTGVASSCAAPISVSYDSVGRIVSKSDVGAYQYKGSAPDAVSSIVQPNGAILGFEYDANGAAIRSPQVGMCYNTSNQVSLLSSGCRYTCFDYTHDGRSYRMDTFDGRVRSVTTRSGVYEQIASSWSESHHRRRLSVRQRHFIVGNEGIVAVLESIQDTESKHKKAATFLSGVLRYVHRDRLGSITMLTDERGCVTQRFTYDPWGGRQVAGCDLSFARGFTGHENMDEFGLVNMNGRLFDSRIALFLQADSAGPGPRNGQSLNRFIYALNNPQKYIDPSGHFSLGDIFSAIASPFVAIAKVVATAVVEVGKWIVENWRPIVSIAAGIVVGILAAPLGPIAAAAIGGFVYGGTSAALYGGSFTDIIKGALLGAATGAAFGAIASAGLSYFETAGLHALAGGASSAAQGGDFWRGTLSGAVGGFAAPMIAGIRGFDGAGLARAAGVAVVGGTTSVIGGGKFANGAGYGLFKCVAAEGAVDILRGKGRPLTDEEKAWIEKNHPNANSIDLESVRVYNGRFFGPQTSSFLMSPDGNIYLGGDASQPAPNLATTGVANQNLLIHEITHVWQFQQGVNVWFERVALTITHPFSDLYDWKGVPPGQPLNIEQQAQKIQETYRIAPQNGGR